jgi:hypothetical protein
VTSPSQGELPFGWLVRMGSNYYNTTPKGNMRPLRNGSLSTGWVHREGGPAEWPGPREGMKLS